VALPKEPLYYGDYLCIDKLLDCQQPRSGNGKDAAHDEMLFIIIHQSYELWFKQILHELDSVAALFQAQNVDAYNMGFVVRRLERVIEIQHVLVSQLNVIETMTPLDFLEFRDYLVPASGFQSIQFRRVEQMLGLRHGDRTSFSQDAYRKRLRQDHRDQLEAGEEQPSLFQLVEAWLERTPFLDLEGYSFWDEYRAAVSRMLQEERRIISEHATLSEDAKKDQLGQLDSTEKNFTALFDDDDQTSTRRLSDRATRAALFIHLYRDYPALQLPHKLLVRLLDVDELFTSWRQRHAVMVHRMIGRKIGTGGSSGHKYLRASAEKHKVFADLFDLSSYLIPRSALPKLPAGVEQRMRFNYEETL